MSDHAAPVPASQAGSAVRPRGRAAPVGRQAPAPAIVAEVLRSPGAALDPATRAFFEPRFGHDFSRVQVHADARAAASAHAVHALAYTVGQHVVLGGQGSPPGSPAGRWLLAHELAHVVQARQAGAGGDRTAVEKDADRAASAVLAGRSAHLERGHDGKRMHRFGQPDSVPELTFVAGTNPTGDSFLDHAMDYHKVWGLKPRTVESLEAIVDELGAKGGALGRIRIVSHALQAGLFLRMFAGSDAITIGEDLLQGFAASDVAGLSVMLGPVADPATPGLVLDKLRSSKPEVLKPFGLDKPDPPQGAVKSLIDRSTDLLSLQQQKEGDPGQAATLKEALQTILAGLRRQVEIETKVSSQRAQALQDAILGLGGEFTFEGAQQPATLIADVKAANVAIAKGFRKKLDKAKARLSSGSWIDIRGCKVGDSPSYMRAVAAFFGTAAKQPHVSAPDWWQSFPILGWKSLDDSDVAGAAADPDVRLALDRWAPITGIRRPQAATGGVADPAEELGRYLDAKLVLPVQASADVDAITLYMKHKVRQQAMANWLDSQWASAAPGLKQLKNGTWDDPAPRRVAALSKLYVSGTGQEIVISPDPQYQAHIKKI